MTGHCVLIVSAILLLSSIAQRSGSSPLSTHHQSPSRRRHHNHHANENVTQGPPMHAIFRHHKHRSHQPSRPTPSTKYQDNQIDTSLNLSQHPDLRLHHQQLNNKQHDKSTTTTTQRSTFRPHSTTTKSPTISNKNLKEFQPNKKSPNVNPLNLTRLTRPRYDSNYSEVTRRPTILSRSTTTTTSSTAAPLPLIRLRHQKDALWSEHQPPEEPSAVNQLLSSDDSDWSSEFNEHSTNDNDNFEDYFFDEYDIIGSPSEGSKKASKTRSPNSKRNIMLRSGYEGHHVVSEFILYKYLI